MVLRPGVYLRAALLPFSRVLSVPDSELTSVKGQLEAMHPTSPSLRWEAHCGYPVSTLCVVDNTSLVVTASTDSTLRLFTLADIQVIDDLINKTGASKLL